MTDKEKRELKDGVVSIFKRFNILDHTSTIGNLRDDILRYINSLQEEPVSIDFEQELYKAFGQVKDFTLGMRIAKWFYDMGKNSHEPVSEDLEEASVEWFNSVKYKSDLSGTPINAFKAGAKWGKNQAKVEIQAQSMALAHGCPKKQVSEDLKKAALKAMKED